MDKLEILELITKNGFDYNLDTKDYLLELIGDRWQLTFFWCNNQVSFITYKKVYNSNIYTKKMLDLIYQVSEVITKYGKEFWREQL